jgi:hypothetical protein
MKIPLWQESTSASPSGRHLRHYKALVAMIDRTLEEGERSKYRNFQTEIAECYITMINKLCYQTQVFPRPMENNRLYDDI